MSKDLNEPGVARTEAFTVKPLITAQEAFPELERQFLAARTEIWASFRIFDLDTRLRSDEGRAIGRTWLDLVAHRLRAGVAIHFALTDFDPHLAVPLHFGTWRSVRQFAAAREIAGACRLDMRPMMHPSRAGLGPRAVFWPLVLRKLRSALKKLDGKPGMRAHVIETAAGLKTRVRLGEDQRLRVAAMPMPEIFPAIYHQKLAVFDRRTLFIGGLDVDERRYDDPEHRRPAAATWHDVSVVTEGPCVAEAQAHLEAQMEGRPPAPAKQRLSDNPAFVRTVAGDARDFLRLSPRPLIQEIEAAHFELFAQAEHLIYVETQFFRHRPFARALARAARERPNLQLIMMLPAAPENVAFEHARGADARFGEYLQAYCVRKVRRAFGPRAFVGMPLRPVEHHTEERDTTLGSDIIYIHSKIAIADDARAIVSSANLNGRSMRWDTEAGVVVSDTPTVSFLRRRLFEHWLPGNAPEPFFGLRTAEQRWSELARTNASLAPGKRQGFIAPYDVRAAEEFGRNVPLMPEELV